MGSFNNKISAEYNPPRKWILERALSYRDKNIDVDALEKIGMTGIRGHAEQAESPTLLQPSTKDRIAKTDRPMHSAIVQRFRWSEA